MESQTQLQSLLHSLRKSQLVDLLVDLGLKIPEAAEEIRAAASNHIAHRKLFVHNLSLDTTSESLCEAFSSLGEVMEAAVIADKLTGKSRCFGFVTFRNTASAQKAMEKSSLSIDGRPAFYKLAGAESGNAAAIANAEWRRLFVTGFSLDTTTDDLCRFFEKYGEIEDVVVISDAETNGSRGFGFVTFRIGKDARKAMADPDKILAGKRLFVKYSQGKETQAHGADTYAP